MADHPYRVVAAGCRLLFRALALQLTVVGAERVPAHGPVVLAANHSSFADFAVVGQVGRSRGRFVRFLTKQSVFAVPVVGAAMRAMGHIAVDRSCGQVAARHALRALTAGEVVGIYPEATIGRAFTVKDRADVRRGAAYLALRTGAALVPVAHWGVHRLVTVGGRRSLRRGVAVTVVVGDPLVPLPGEDADELTTRLHAVLERMVAGVVRDYPQPPPDPAAAWWWPAELGGGAPSRACARVLDADAVRRVDAPRRVDGGLRRRR